MAKCPICGNSITNQRKAASRPEGGPEICAYCANIYGKSTVPPFEKVKEMWADNDAKMASFNQTEAFDLSQNVMVYFDDTRGWFSLWEKGVKCKHVVYSFADLEDVQIVQQANKLNQAIISVRNQNGSMDYKMWNPFPAAIERFREKCKASSAPPGPPAADELIKYKGLLDSGAITEAEYSDVKARLLSGTTTPKTVINQPKTVNQSPPPVSTSKRSWSTAKTIVVTLVIVLVVLIAVCAAIGAFLGSSAENSPVTGEGVTQVFDAKRFLVIDGDKTRPMTAEELVAEIGEPESVEDWEYDFQGTTYPIQTLSYHSGNYKYIIGEDQLVRIEIYIPASYSSKSSIAEMYNLDSGEIAINSDTSYKIENCGVHDLWCLMDPEKTSTINIAYITYSNFFDAPESPRMVVTESDRLLEFDSRTWDDFTNLYKAHNNLLDWVESFSNGMVGTLEFYQTCQELEEYFASASLSFDYGTTDAQNDYLSSFEAMAIADQSATKYLMKYLDTWKVSYLSDANTEIQRASEAATIIASNRGTLLGMTDLTDEEIQKKIEFDMNDLE